MMVRIGDNHDYSCKVSLRVCRRRTWQSLKTEELLRGACHEENGQILRSAQTDIWRRSRNDNSCGEIQGVCSALGGFTLLELVISISLIGIIVLIVTGAMRLGTRAIESSEKKIAVLERTRSSLNIIDAQIQSYIPLVYVEDGEKRYYFKGDRESLQFSTNYSIWGGEKGYVIATYTVKSLDDGKQAIFASETVVGRRNRVETMLTNPCDRVYFDFYAKDPLEERGEWVDEWTDNISLPGADRANIPEKVRIHLIDGADDFDLVVPVRVKMSAADLAAAGGFEGEFIAEE